MEKNLPWAHVTNSSEAADLPGLACFFLSRDPDHKHFQIDQLCIVQFGFKPLRGSQACVPEGVPGEALMIPGYTGPFSDGRQDKPSNLLT